MLARSLPGRRASSAHLENPLATPLDRALARAVHEVRLLAAVTPVNLQAERVRLAVELERGEAALPRFVYAPSARTDLRRALDAMAEALSGEVDAPLETLYRERIEELSLEARIAESVGLASLGTLASARFSMDDPAISVRCRAIAADWLRIPARPSGPTILSDSEQSGSLLREMQREIGLLRLPFAVRTSPALLSLAATGDTTLWI